MPTKEISPSREGRDQRSDSPTKDAASSNRRVGDFATRRETCQYAASDDLLQQGVGEQAYERELARKGKNLAIPDETSWHSDTSSSGYSSGSDSDAETTLLKADRSENEKLVLTDKSGLLGGMDGFGGIAGATAAGIHEGARHTEASLERLVCCCINLGIKHHERKKQERQRLEIVEAKKMIEDEFWGHFQDLKKKHEWLENFTFDDHKRRNPDIRDEDRPHVESSRQSQIKECREEANFMLKLGSERWHEYREYNKRQEIAETKKRLENKFREHYQGLKEKHEWLNNFTFDDHKRRNPDIRDEDRPRFKSSRRSQMKECKKEMDLMLKLGPERWYWYLEYKKIQEGYCARYSDQGASTSRGQDSSERRQQRTAENNDHRS